MRILAIASSIGGTGKTITSIALAAAFQRFGLRTALIDFDIGFGNIARVIGSTRLGPDLLDVIDSTGPLAAEWGPESDPGKLLVIPSSQLSDRPVLSTLQIKVLFARCKAFGLDTIVCDLPPGLDQPLSSMVDLADDIIVTSPAAMSLAYTVSPLLHRLRARRSRAAKACGLHLLITRSPPHAGTPKQWPLGGHFPDLEQLPLLGVIAEVEAPHQGSGSAVEPGPLQDEGVLAAYADVARRLLHIAEAPHEVA